MTDIVTSPSTMMYTLGIADMVSPHGGHNDTHGLPRPANATSVQLTEVTTLGMANSTPANGSDQMTMGEQIPLASSVTLIILYTLTTVAAVVGNSLAILVFTRGKRSNTDLRLFLINLAVADLIMAIFCIPFTFAYQILEDWVFTDVMCPIVQCCQVVSVTASVSTNTAIGIDRLVAVKFPLRKRVTSSRTKLVILIIWTFAVSMGIVPLVMSRTRERYGKVACEEDWPDQQGRLAYGFCIIIITYFLPVTVLSVTYSMIGRQLWKHKLPGNADDQRDAVQLRSKRKVVKMLATIVLLFGVCWLPLHLFIITINFNETAFGNAANEIYFGVHWLSMANSFVNPVVYGFMNDNFRADLSSMIQACLCCHWRHQRLKYRPAAVRWRLGDSNVHDTASPGYQHCYTSASQLSHSPHTPRLHAPVRNGHAPGHSPQLDPGREMCACRTDQNERHEKTGRTIFQAGKRRHYELCRNEDSRPCSGEGEVLANKRPSPCGNGRLSGGGPDVHTTAFYDGADSVLLTTASKLDKT